MHASSPLLFPLHLQASTVKLLCEKAKAILMEEKNVHAVPRPATIVGDIHGQFWDLLELFAVGGEVRTSGLQRAARDLGSPLIHPSILR